MTEQSATPLALALWARQFATLVGAGVSLMRSLDLLKGGSPPPLDEVTADLMARIEAGSTLSAAMREHPEVFKRVALLIVRAGEVGGVLDETLAVWSEWLARDLEWHAKLHNHVLLARALGLVETKDKGFALVQGSLPDFGRRSEEYLYCAMASMMLQSGVPLGMALEVAAEACAEDAERTEVLRHGLDLDKERVAARLAEAGFTPLTVQLVAVGEETSTLDRALAQAAQALRYELETSMVVALSGLREGLEEKAPP